MSRSDAAFHEAGAAVVAGLTAYAGQLGEGLQAAVADEPDAVHQARILVRRLRSALAAYRRLFDVATVRRLRSALSELGDELGEVRDVEVRMRHAEDQVDSDVPKEVRERLIHDEQKRYRSERERLVTYLADVDDVSERLAEFLAHPPFSPPADEPARAELARLLRKEAKRVRKAEDAAVGDLESLHRLRRAARRLRYACEAVSSPPVEVFGKEVGDVADAAHTVQELLGDHRDELLFALQVRREGAAAREAGEQGDGYSTVAADAFYAAASRLEELPVALSTFRKRARAFASLG